MGKFRHLLLIVAIIATFVISSGCRVGSSSILHNYSKNIIQNNDKQYEIDFESTRLIQSTFMTQLYLPIVLKKYPFISVFGMSAGSNFDKIKTTDVEWIRLTHYLDWSQVEPERGQPYQWSNVGDLEAKLRVINQQSLETILTIGGTPHWAQKYQHDCSLITSDKLEDFINFVQESVRRYSQTDFNVKYYMIYNEPDMPNCWGEASNPEDRFFGGEYYGRLLNLLYSKIKSVNPLAQVIVGGLLLDCDPRGVGDGFCPTQAEATKWNFFEGVVKSAGNSFDFVAFHTYSYYGETGEQNSPVWKERHRDKWWKNGGVVDGKISYLQEVMRKYGIEKPLIITEAGLLYSDQPFPNNTVKEDYESQKADYIAWVYANAWSKGVKGVTWYAFEGWRKTELFRDGQELPAFQALKTMTGFLKYADYINREDNPGFTKFIYRNGNEIIWLLIPTGQQYGTVYTILAPSKLKRVVDLFGNEQTISGQSINFTRPTYVFINP